jgi:arginine decarboxylase
MYMYTHHSQIQYRPSLHTAPHLIDSTPHTGFTGLAPGWCMLDPIKVAIVTPGMAPDGTLQPNGIPAAIVSAYLSERGIIVARTMDFMLLFLFSIGITKGKWGTLLSALLAFRADYER